MARWWLVWLLQLPSSAKEVRPPPALDCFGDGNLEPGWFPEHLCCDAEQWPPNGWWKCWGGDFTYENCSGEGPSCTDELVAEVWKFLAPKSERTYRDLWWSNTYYGIARVRWESGCQLPFVASRVLALTKLDWTDQWEILHFPRRAIHHSNFQLRSIVDAMWTMIQDISLEDFLTSGKWAETILTRLYAHSKKTAYYLLSDGMPLLSGRLPLSDTFLSKEDEDFQHLLRRRLNLHLPLPMVDAKNYLARNATAAFGRIAAFLVLALNDNSALQRAQHLLRSWVEKNDYGDLFFSHWPIYRLMLYLHRKLSQDSHAEMYSETAKLSQSMQRAWEQSAEMLVISCLPNLTASLPEGWHHTLGCHGSWRQLLDGRENVRWVLLISSTVHWTENHVGSIREGLALAEEAGRKAVGFPTVDGNGTWRWPVRRLEMAGEKEASPSVRYSPYPTGYAGSQGRCCRGDTTSGTRAYHFKTLAQLFEEVDRFAVGAPTMSTLLQRLDFLGSSNSISGSMTCMVPPLVEDDYVGTTLVHHAGLPEDMQKMWQQTSRYTSQPLTVPMSQDFDVPELEDPKSSLSSVAVLYCGELGLSIESRFVANIFQESLKNCAQILRRAAKRLPRDSWVLFVSPFVVDVPTVDIKLVEALRHALRGRPDAVAAGVLPGDRGQREFPGASITYRFYKLQYRRLVSPFHVLSSSCFLGDASSGTRLYRPGVLPDLLKKTVTMDVATLMVELDLLAKLGGSAPSRRKKSRGAVPEKKWERPGRILTCALPEGTRIPREEDYLQKAQLPDAFVQLFQVEAVDYAGRMLLANNPAIVAGAPNGTDWQLAHNVADQRLATSLLYRRRIEDDFVKIVQWWTALDDRHFAAPKQGTLLTAMIRGGDVSMMPWDTDLELALYSTGANPVLGWCDDILDLEERRGCVLRRLEEELQMPVQLGPDQLT